jgi:ABC-type nickel/cobalt efflux system permease component RcnA
LDQLKEESANMKTMIEELKKEYLMMQAGEQDVELDIDHEMAMKREELMASFKYEIANLEKHISDLAPMLKADSAVDVSEKDKKKKDDEFKAEEGQDWRDYEDKIAVDLEAKIVKQLGTHDAALVRFKHTHVHKHKYKHVHKHKHIHLDQESIAEMEDVDRKFRDAHVIRHTTTHTQTQYLVPKRWFGMGAALTTGFKFW